MPSCVRRRRVALLLALLSSLVGAKKQSPIEGGSRSATLKPALFMRESLVATREALAAAYRLSPDARLVGAIPLVASLWVRRFPSRLQ